MELRYVPHFRGRGSGEELNALPHTLEPPVPFPRVQDDDYGAAKPFDYVVLCQSPRYIPIEADALIPILGDYADFIADGSQKISGLDRHPCDMRAAR